MRLKPIIADHLQILFAFFIGEKGGDFGQIFHIKKADII